MNAGGLEMSRDNFDDINQDIYLNTLKLIVMNISSHIGVNTNLLYKEFSVNEGDKYKELFEFTENSIFKIQKEFQETILFLIKRIITNENTMERLYDIMRMEGNEYGAQAIIYALESFKHSPYTKFNEYYEAWKNTF